VTAVTARPGREELGEILAGLDGRRLVVCGTDADLAAVLLRLLRTDVVGTVPVGYVPIGTSSVVARRWGLPTAPSTAADLALRGEPDGVPLLRDDAGGVLVGLGVVRPVDGVAYCDDEVVLRGRAARLEVAPDRALGLMVRVVRGGLLRHRAVRQASGRAVQLGCAPTDVWRDGVADRTTDRWTWYRHTEDWQLIRP
jgi:Diacylglycerol kinase catalytic domain